jgi:hypothetical protein
MMKDSLDGDNIFPSAADDLKRARDQEASKLILLKPGVLRPDLMHNNTEY